MRGMFGRGGGNITEDHNLVIVSAPISPVEIKSRPHKLYKQLTGMGILNLFMSKEQRKPSNIM